MKNMKTKMKKILLLAITLAFIMSVLPMALPVPAIAENEYAVAVYRLAFTDTQPHMPILVTVGGREYTVETRAWAAAVALNIVNAVNNDPQSAVTIVRTGEDGNREIRVTSNIPGPAGADLVHMTIQSPPNQTGTIVLTRQGDFARAVYSITCPAGQPQFDITVRVAGREYILPTRAWAAEIVAGIANAVNSDPDSPVSIVVNPARNREFDVISKVEGPEGRDLVAMEIIVPEGGEEMLLFRRLDDIDLSAFTLYMVPNSHIDTAWTWPYAHTVITIFPETFNSVFARFDESAGRDDIFFSKPGSLHYQWIYEYHPEIFERIRGYVEAGRWEFTGGYITEPDAIMPSGESLVRHILYSQHYFIETFGKEHMPRVFGLFDSFGSTAQLPQFARKGGLPYLVAWRIGGSDSARNSNLFWWRASDGVSKVLSHALPFSYVGLNANQGNWINADAVRHYLMQNQRPGFETNIPKAIAFYGRGDHGGGFNQAEFDLPLRSNANTQANVIRSTAANFFDNIVRDYAAELEELVIVDNMMHLTSMRGVWTSWARIKYDNRRGENLAVSAEKAAALSYWTGSLSTNSADRVQDAWERILLNQFHDVLPGVAIPYAYYEAFNFNELSRNLLNNVQDNALIGLAYQADTNVPGIPVFVYNSLSWERSGSVEVTLSFGSDSGGLPAYVIIRDGERELPVHELSRSTADNTITVRFTAPDVPSLGYRVFSAEGGSRPSNASSDLRFDPDTLTVSNSNISFTLNPETGFISSLKRGGREFLPPGREAGELHVYNEAPGRGSNEPGTAWTARPQHMSGEPYYKITGRPDSIQVIQNDSDRVAVRVTKTWRDSTIIQDFSLSPGSDRVDITMDVSWRERLMFLKVSVPIMADTEIAYHEIAYGAYAFSIATNRAAGNHYELPGHSWVDITDRSGSHGMSLLNDAKYGYDHWRRSVGGVTYIQSRISVVRSPVNPTCSRTPLWPPRENSIDIAGSHSFTYSLFPHDGDWRRAGTVRQALDLNNPMPAMQVQRSGGALGTYHSFMSTDRDNVIISAVKHTHRNVRDRNTLILRLYESDGLDTAGVTVTMPANIISAREVNLLETIEVESFTPDKAVTVSGSALSFDMGRYEVLTLEVTLEPFSGKVPVFTQAGADLTGHFNVNGVSFDDNMRDANMDGLGNSIPAPLWPATVNYQGVIFTMASTIGNGANNFVGANGQNIAVPAGSFNRLFILGAYTSAEDRQAMGSGRFRVLYSDGSYSDTPLTFANWRGRLSGWDRWAMEDIRPAVHDTVGYVFTHYHNGVRDVPINNNYLYIYSIELDPARTPVSLILPYAEGIKIAAVTAVNTSVPIRAFNTPAVPVGLMQAGTGAALAAGGTAMNTEEFPGILTAGDGQSPASRNVNTGILVFLLIGAAAVIGAGAGCYFKVIRPKQRKERREAADSQ